MAVILRPDRMMGDRKISLNDLSERAGISIVNLSNLKTSKVKAIRFSTLNAICRLPPLGIEMSARRFIGI